MGLLDMLFGIKPSDPAEVEKQFPYREEEGIVTAGSEFPKGTKGLKQITTFYENGQSTCFIFHDQEQADKLTKVASSLNEFIFEAERVCGLSLNKIENLVCIVPGINLSELDDDGASYSYWNFCRAEYHPETKTGKPNKTPVKCYIDTSLHQEAGAINATVWFDCDGGINKAKITCLGDNYWPWQGNTCLECTTLEIGTVRGSLILKKVFSSDEAANQSEVLYDYRDKPVNATLIVETDKKADTPVEKNWEQLRDEGNELRRNALMSKGVDLDRFDEMKCIEDAMFLLDSFIPAYSILGVDFNRFRASVEYSNLTKTGNVPKNVVTEHVDLFGSQENDWIILHIKCLADGTINMADIHLWRNHIRHGVSIRTKNGAYTITNIVKNDAKRDYLEPLFTGDPNADPFKVLDQSLKNTWL